MKEFWKQFGLIWGGMALLLGGAAAYGTLMLGAWFLGFFLFGYVGASIFVVIFIVGVYAAAIAADKASEVKRKGTK